MKHLLVIVTISCILAKDVYQFSWDIWFSIHQTEIAEKLCENKANPLLNCNGHCYLSKQLKKAVIDLEKDLKDSSSSRTKIMNEVKVIEFKTVRLSFQPTAFSDREKTLAEYVPTRWDYLNDSAIEHPPSIG